MKPEEVLELIRSASQRYESVRAALRYRGDGPTHKEIRERIARTEAGRRAFRVSPQEASERIERPIDHPEPDGPYGWSCRAWYAGKYRERLETDVPGGGVSISAVDGYMRFWRHRVGAGPREDDPRWFSLAEDHYWTFYALLTDEICGISRRLRPLDLTVEGPLWWAGREAYRLVGVPGERWDWGWDPDPLSWGADEYEAVVDAERGVLLRCASRLGGKDFDALEVEEIHFDEEFPEEVFTSREPLPWH
ncbi:MAG: hypothetical protein M3P70_10215 [Actinomycetota bacterium]|nr:hypothetical protein [Actinomycetota bacterium]